MIFGRVVYAVAIGVLLVMLVIVGIEAFYPAPSLPVHPRGLLLIVPEPGPEPIICELSDPDEGELVPVDDTDEDDLDMSWWGNPVTLVEHDVPEERHAEIMRLTEEYREQRAVYFMNVFLGVLPLGALLAIGGTFVRRRLDTLGAGLILGGVGTMIYAIVPSELDSVLRFTGLAVGLIVLVLVGFRVLNSSRQA